MNIRIILVCSTKKTNEISVGITLNLQNDLGTGYLNKILICFQEKVKLSISLHPLFYLSVILHHILLQILH